MSRKKKKSNKLGALLIPICLILIGYYLEQNEDIIKETVSTDATTKSEETYEQSKSYKMEDLPNYDGGDYVIVNDNEPYFDENMLVPNSYEKYSDLDKLGRCGVAIANISTELMPTEKRGSIGSVKPTGWHTAKYDFIDGKYLYNRCHLIGYQLTGENANEKNLITCTRQMNTKGMLDFENLVTKYIKDTNNHVLYRVTPVFDGNNLVATGVEMEAYSIEDNGEGIKFNVFVYNVQKGVIIDYATGENWIDEFNVPVVEEKEDTVDDNTVLGEYTYILNI